MILSDRATLTPAGQRMTLLLLYYVYYTSNKVNVRTAIIHIENQTARAKLYINISNNSQTETV